MLDLSFHITTPRLYISHLDPSDETHCDFLREIHQDGTNSMWDRDAIRKSIENGLGRMKKGGWGRYLVSLRPSTNHKTTVQDDYSEDCEDQFAHQIKHCLRVGIVSMQLGRFPIAPTIPDIGFRTHPRYFGKGYATEAASSLMKYFEEEIGVKSFAGFCNKDNEASKSVLKKLGLEVQGLKDVAGIYGDGSPLTVLVWTKGVDGKLEQYGI